MSMCDQKLQVADNRDYYLNNEDSLQEAVHSCDAMNFLILHQNVMSVVNKYNDFVNFLHP